MGSSVQKEWQQQQPQSRCSDQPAVKTGRAKEKKQTFSLSFPICEPGQEGTTPREALTLPVSSSGNTHTPSPDAGSFS